MPDQVIIQYIQHMVSFKLNPYPDYTIMYKPYRTDIQREHCGDIRKFTRNASTDNYVTARSQSK